MNNQMIHINLKENTQICSTHRCSCYHLLDFTKYSRVMTESLLVIVIDHVRVKNWMQKSEQTNILKSKTQDGEFNF